MTKSKISFLEVLPSFDRSNCLLIFDQRLMKEHSAWIRQFPNSYSVKSGESLKNLGAFPKHAEKLMNLTASLPAKSMKVVAFGGGSVGDFAGFFASVFKRGVELVHVPSTWLSAIDSAHGGKTALNVAGVKNQIGTFYPAAQIFLVREVLEKLPPKRAEEAWAEAVKVALLQGGLLWKKLGQSKGSAELWSFLPALIEAKMKVVKQDPLEQQGIRHLLNLGHTVGHVLEAELELAHGVAVGYGLRFALEWSKQKKILQDSSLDQISGIPDRADLAAQLRRLKKAKQLLSQDKKKQKSQSLRFVFLRKPGQALIQTVEIQTILSEIERIKKAHV